MIINIDELFFNVLYCNGKLCKKCGKTKRYIKNYNCVNCNILRNEKWAKKEIKDLNKEYKKIEKR